MGFKRSVLHEVAEEIEITEALDRGLRPAAHARMGGVLRRLRGTGTLRLRV